MIDVIIVSNAFNSFLKMITESTIRTAKKGETDIDLNFIIVEQNKDVKYDYQTIHYSFPFNYNRCLNIGIKAGTAPYVALCNNDLVFYRHWGWNAVIALERFDSISPASKFFTGVKIGYGIEKEVLGWCIIVKREVLEAIGYLDTPCEFWYSDNVYAHQLKMHGFKHALIGNCLVKHLTSVTVNKMPFNLRQHYMKKQSVKFNQYKNHVNQSIKK